MNSDSRRLTKSWDALADWGSSRRSQATVDDPTTTQQQQQQPPTVTAIATVQPQKRQVERARHSVRRFVSRTEQQHKQHQHEHEHEHQLKHQHQQPSQAVVQAEDRRLSQSHGSAHLIGCLRGVGGGGGGSIGAVHEARVPSSAPPGRPVQLPRPGLSPRVMSIEDSLLESSSAAGSSSSNSQESWRKVKDA